MRLEYRREVFRWAARQVRKEFRQDTWDAFWLTAVEGRSVEAVAKELAKDAGAIYAARSRVMRRIREKVTEYEQDSTSGRSDAATWCPSLTRKVRLESLTDRRCTMNTTERPAIRERIELFLEQKLSDEEQSAFESHLGDCGDCRRRLETAAASEDLWSEVRESLRDEQLPPDGPAVGRLRLDGDEDASSSQATVLKLLGAHGRRSDARPLGDV